jgi:hypothetical protein
MSPPPPPPHWIAEPTHGASEHAADNSVPLIRGVLGTAGAIAVAIAAQEFIRQCFRPPGTVRVFGRNLHSRMPLDPTQVRLKRTCV